MGGLSSDLWQPVGLTIVLAGITTLILLLIGTPIAWWLARSHAWWKEIASAVIALPLVLPPTVLGFYLLLTLGPDGPGGAIAGLWGGRTLAFTFEGLVVGSVLYSMPFVVQPIRNSYAAIGDRPLEVAATLRRPAIGGGARAIATLVHAAPGAASMLELVRGALAEAPGECAASVWDGLLVARFLAPDGASLRAAVLAALRALRDGRPLPRVWCC